MKTFAAGYQTAKSVEVFFLETFLLYGILQQAITFPKLSLSDAPWGSVYGVWWFYFQKSAIHIVYSLSNVPAVLINCR